MAPSCFCTASSRCTRIAGPGAAMCFFLAQISLTNIIRTRYCGLVPKPFGLASQPLATSIAGLAPDQPGPYLTFFFLSGGANCIAHCRKAAIRPREARKFFFTCSF